MGAAASTKEDFFVPGPLKAHFTFATTAFLNYRLLSLTDGCIMLDAVIYKLICDNFDIIAWSEPE